ncbi:hypothetical protein FQN51_003714 [Onygenales sp. PD_10]|nr:hypothetical protein FQN51_003714 [Onygenales sp. PD_10]
MDDQSLEVTIQLMRLDITDALAVGNGNTTDESLTDRDIALQLYQEDLNTLQSTLNDRRMARSITGAVQQDGDVLDILAQEEDRARHDREIAVNMGGNRNSTVGTLQQTDVTTDVTTDETPEEAENEKLAEGDPTMRGRETDCFETHDVNVCDVHGPEEARRECAAYLFQGSLQDETLFPPSCCRQLIPLGLVEELMEAELAQQFRDKSVEHSDTNKIYCSRPSCSQRPVSIAKQLYIPALALMKERNRLSWTRLQQKDGSDVFDAAL